jgi:vacuolar-type H+-ATPase subunit H
MASILSEVKTTMTGLQATMPAMVEAEYQAQAEARDAKRTVESFFERARRHAEKAARDAVAEAKEQAAAILAEGQARSQAMEARASQLGSELVDDLRQAIAEVYIQEQEAFTRLNTATHARLLEELERAASVARSLPVDDPPAAGESSDDAPMATPPAPEPVRRDPSPATADLPPWTDATASVPKRELPEGRLVAAPEADEEFWAELRRAMNDDAPLGPRDDLNTVVDSPVSGHVGGQVAEAPRRHSGQEPGGDQASEGSGDARLAPPQADAEQAPTPWNQ